MLAADYVATALQDGSVHEFTLFARNPRRAAEAMTSRGVTVVPECLPLDQFGCAQWDAVINFIGVGDPARAVLIGADILRLTQHWDEKVLAYLEDHPFCRYIFLSSGAVFGENVSSPSQDMTRAKFPINNLQPSHWYGISKFYAEALHRATPNQSIVDVRVFNYVSEFVDLTHRFLISEVLRAVKKNEIISVSAADIRRDYLSRQDFTRLINVCLAAPEGINAAVDAYSISPISKFELLALFKENFNLQYNILGGGIDATGVKSAYYSRNTIAAEFGFVPRHTSAETLLSVARKIALS